MGLQGAQCPRPGTSFYFPGRPVEALFLFRALIPYEPTFKPKWPLSQFSLSLLASLSVGVGAKRVWG